jgi:hypothetical protein
MKSRARLLFLLFMLIIGSLSCSRSSEQTAATRSVAQLEAAPAQTENDKGGIAKTETKNAYAFDDNVKQVSLTDGEKIAEVSAAADRKIIRNADMTIEVPSPTETQHRIVSIAEMHGGFVVTSEAKQRDGSEPTKRTLDIRLVVRIPETQFGAALDQIRGLTTNLTHENVTGQDVTEEFIDLEARIKTQKALEAQFLQIMRQTGKIVDALEVQRQIAEVRTEIERLEGRKRFLENRSSLSTITVNIQAPKPIIAVTETGFRQSVRDSVSESVDVGSGIVLFFVRFAIVMVPISLLVLLPCGLLVRYFMRRAKRMRLAEALSTPSAG